MNRIESAIAKMKLQIADRIATGQTTQAKVDALDLDMDIVEYVKFQELKSLAQMNGKLSLEEAMTIYGYLGNSVTMFNRQAVAVKVVLTRIYAELLSARI